MSKKKIGKVKLTNREEEIMQIIWELGKAFPKEIMEYLEMLMSYFMKEENVDIEELEKLVKQLKKEKKSKG